VAHPVINGHGGERQAEKEAGDVFAHRCQANGSGVKPSLAIVAPVVENGCRAEMGPQNTQL
jgi:hypothetical protein